MLDRPTALRLIRISVVLSLLVMGWVIWRATAPQISPAPLRIGALRALTGPMAISGKAMVAAIQLAVDELNAQGGLLGRPVQLVVADTQSNHALAAQEAERLITQEQVAVLIGCWTSLCRQAVKTVVERQEHLLIYPLQYEGMELSRHILYTGAAPNQQIGPGAAWALSRFGKHAYLVGSNYVFSHTAHRMVKDFVAVRQGQVLGERYVPLGSTDLQAIVRDIARRKPDVVFNTLTGPSNETFFAALVQAGLQNLPVLSFSLAEPEMQAWGGDRLHQHFAVWGYFQSLPTAESQAFVAAMQQRLGPDALVSDPMVSAYLGVHLWANTVSAIHTADPPLVSTALLLQSTPSPMGYATVDPESRHLWRRVRIGQVQPGGQFKEIEASPEVVRPTPWPGYRSRKAWQELLEKPV